MATSVYTVPALAAVGLTEAAARQKGFAIDVHTNDMHDWFSAKTYAETVAWSKIIVDRVTDRILGAHFVGHAGQELVNLFGLAMRFGLTAGADPRQRLRLSDVFLRHQAHARARLSHSAALWSPEPTGISLLAAISTMVMT